MPEIDKPPCRIKNPLKRLSQRHLSKTPSHTPRQKSRGWIGRLFVNRRWSTLRMVPGLQILSSRFLGSVLARCSWNHLTKNHNILRGGFGPIKVAIACQPLHLVKSSEIKIISKPRWAIELYTFRQNLSTGDSRKEYPLPVIVSGRANSACGPGDNLEPVIAVMFPDED